MTEINESKTGECRYWYLSTMWFTTIKIATCFLSKTNSYLNMPMIIIFQKLHSFHY